MPSDATKKIMILSKFMYLFRYPHSTEVINKGLKDFIYPK